MLRSNAKGYDRVSCALLCTAAHHPTGLTPEQLPREPGSFRVSWTPPASLANLTGYRIYYSGAGGSGSMDVDASVTEVTIDNRIAGVTYIITVVALSSHLPSPVVGPVTVTLGEDSSDNVTCDEPTSLHIACMYIPWFFIPVTCTYQTANQI